MRKSVPELPAIGGLQSDLQRSTGAGFRYTLIAMRTPSLAFLGILGACAMACSSSSESSGSAADKAGTSKTVGIDPLIYKCENLVTLDDVSQALGGQVQLMQVAFEPPPGTAEPCHYQLTLDGGTQQPWSFDLDCRPDALKTADKLFAQYQVNRMNDAGAVTNETGMIAVGRKAMDHHGQALIAVDDDTDCYMRVLGPSAEGRAALGKLLVDKLEWKNAPMRPRAL